MNLLHVSLLLGTFVFVTVVPSDNVLWLGSFRHGLTFQRRRDLCVTIVRRLYPYRLIQC